MAEYQFHGHVPIIEANSKPMRIEEVSNDQRPREPLPSEQSRGWQII